MCSYVNIKLRLCGLWNAGLLFEWLVDRMIKEVFVFFLGIFFSKRLHLLMDRVFNNKINLLTIKLIHWFIYQLID